MSTVKAINFQHPSATAVNLALAADGSVSGGLPAGGRNIAYNGAFQVNQRSSSVAGITTGNYYTSDRWLTLFTNTVGTWTQSVEADAPTGSGFRNSLKMLCTTAKSVVTTDLLGIAQKFEGQDLQKIKKGTSSAQPLTLSFWVKGNVTGTYIALLYDEDNNRQVAASYTISASGTWERKTITFPADTTGAFANDNSTALWLFFHLAAGADLQSGTLQTTWATYNAANRAVGQVNVAAATSNYWQVTGVQLETGSIATDFEFKSYGQELRECQRYYEKSYMQNVVPGTAAGDGCVIHFCDGLNSATRTLFYTVNYKVTKRTNAPLVAYSTVTGAANKVRDITATADVNALYSVYSDSGAVVYWTNGASQTLFNNQFQWTASAEL